MADGRIEDRDVLDAVVVKIAFFAAGGYDETASGCQANQRTPSLRSPRVGASGAAQQGAGDDHVAGSSKS